MSAEALADVRRARALRSGGPFRVPAHGCSAARCGPTHCPPAAHPLLLTARLSLPCPPGHPAQPPPRPRDIFPQTYLPVLLRPLGPLPRSLPLAPGSCEVPHGALSTPRGRETRLRKVHPQDTQHPPGREGPNRGPETRPTSSIHATVAQSPSELLLCISPPCLPPFPGRPRVLLPLPPRLPIHRDSFRTRRT